VTVSFHWQTPFWTGDAGRLPLQSARVRRDEGHHQLLGPGRDLHRGALGQQQERDTTSFSYPGGTCAEEHRGMCGVQGQCYARLCQEAREGEAGRVLPEEKGSGDRETECSLRLQDPENWRQMEGQAEAKKARLHERRDHLGRLEAEPELELLPGACASWPQI